MRVTASDKKWKEENYARTLAEAAAIQGDRAKMAAAKRGAKRIAKEKSDEAAKLRKIAGPVRRKKK